MNNALDIYRGPDPSRQALAIPPAGPDPDRLDLRALLAALRRQRRLALGVMLLVMLLGALLTYLQTPLYTANAQVVLNTRSQQVTPVKEQVVSPLDEQSQAVDTEVAVIGSREMAEHVVDRLHLADRPEFRLPGPPAPAQSRDAAIETVRNGLTIGRIGNTYAMQIGYTAPDPVLAAQVANEIASQYTTEQQRLKTDANRDALRFLAQRIAQLRAQAQADTGRVQQYRIANNLLSTTGASLTEQEISAYNQEVARARAQMAEDQARLGTARAQLNRGSNGDDVGAALDSPVVSSLRGQRAQVSAQVANLKARYGPLHPDVIKAQSELADIDKAIQAEIARVISNLDARSQVSAQRAGSVTGSLAGARATLAQNNHAMVGLDDLQRKAETSQGLYETYLNRYKETAAQEGTEQSDSRIISTAQVPARPSSPRVLLNMFLAIVLGAGCGLAAAFLAEMVYSGITTAQDIEQRFGLSYLAGVPIASSVIPGAGSPIDAIVEHPDSGFAEAVRSIRTSVAHATHGNAQVVLVTSALPQEGKTTIAICLARAVAQQGERVLLIDCDARRRGINRLLGDTTGKKGLIELLRGEAAIDDALVLDQPSGAWLLPLNRSQVSSGDPISGARMIELLGELRKRFDYIVMDSAPVLPIADSRALATIADAVIFVARWRSTTDHSVRSALRLLPAHRTHIAGIVLNRIDMRKQARFGYGDPTYYYSQYKNYYA